MLNNRVLVFGGFLTSALAVVGCSGSSSTPPKDGAATGGAPGTGGAKADGGADSHDASTGTGGTGAGGAPADGGAGRDGASSDAGDVHGDGPSVCITSYGAGNPVLYAFNGGVNLGWYQFSNDPPDGGVTTSLGASFTEGPMCPGALQLGVNFTAYGTPGGMAQSGSIETYFGDSPNGRHWTAYKNLHAWIKVLTADYQQIAGVYFYVKSAAQVRYQAATSVPTGSDLSNGQFREVVIDLTNPGTGPMNGVAANDVQLMGFQVLLNNAPPTGAPTPSQVILLVDDIWLEALPPSDAGADGSDAAPDAPAGG